MSGWAAVLHRGAYSITQSHHTDFQMQSICSVHSLLCSVGTMISICKYMQTYMYIDIFLRSVRSHCTAASSKRRWHRLCCVGRKSFWHATCHRSHYMCSSARQRRSRCAWRVLPMHRRAILPIAATAYCKQLLYMYNWDSATQHSAAAVLCNSACTHACVCVCMRLQVRMYQAVLRSKTILSLRSGASTSDSPLTAILALRKICNHVSIMIQTCMCCMKRHQVHRKPTCESPTSPTVCSHTVSRRHNDISNRRDPVV